MTGTGGKTGSAAQAAAGMVLFTLAIGQFLMILDSSVMNVSMATVAADLGTTITGIQTAITLYMLVMATLMLTGGKIGKIIGRRRAFSLGCVIYGAGSLTTSLSTGLPMLLVGWSLLEGVGAALILPAIVALVASNFAPPERPRAYGLVAAAGAIAVGLGPLIGGGATTFFSWRWVFAGEVIIVALILLLSRRVLDTADNKGTRLDLVGTALSVLGLGAAVFGILRSSEWGWILPKEGSPAILGLSRTFWFIIAGMVITWLLVLWELHLERRGAEPLFRPGMLRNRQLAGGLTMFLFQCIQQSGFFFIIPLFLSVALELSAIQTGVRILPVSLALLLAATGVPKIFPKASPRRVVRIGTFGMALGSLTLASGINIDSNAAVVMVPEIFLGLGLGAMASQLGAVTVSSVPSSESAEVGGLQNTSMNLGLSVGTALAGSVLITVLTASLITGIQQNPDVPDQVKSQAEVQLAPGVPFTSDTALENSLAEANVPPDVSAAVLQENQTARVQGLNVALAILAIIGVISLFFTGRIPDAQPQSSDLEMAA